MNHIHITSGDYYYIVEDLTVAFTEVFSDLGYKVTFELNKFHPEATINLNLGATALSIEDFYSARNSLIHYNLEQISPYNAVAINKEHLERLSLGYVWDFSQQNIQNLKTYGIKDSAYIPIGYTRAMTFIESAKEQDIDVLFYGLVTDRRQKVLDEIEKLGLNVFSSGGTKHTDVALDNRFRNELISRSKVVLNVHAYEYNNIFEIVRVSHLLANKKAVVSEVSPYTFIDTDLINGIAHGTVEELPYICKKYVEYKNDRKLLEQRGFSVFSKRNFKEYVNLGLFSYYVNRMGKNG